VDKYECQSLADGWGLTNDTNSNLLIITDAGYNLHFVVGT
jgi:hypothetical protein